MSNYVILTNTDYQLICDKLREKTGNINLIKSGELAGEIEALSDFINTINISNLADDIINKTVTGIIDDKVSVLRDYALADCENLTHARFLSATSVGQQALGGCTSLVVADFPNVETINLGSFAGCTSLASIFLPSFNSSALMPFYGCTNLQKVNCPVLEQVSYNMFGNLSSLKTVNIPMVTSIGADAFYKDQLLTDVNAPLVNTIYSRAFYNCSSLKEANFPLLTSIDKQAFYGCESLTTINFPNLEYLGMPADGVGVVPDSIEIFKNCSNLKTVILPLVKEIHDSSFYNCAELTYVDVPSVESIGYGAFYHCNKLTTINCPNLKTVGSQAFTGCGELTNINVPLLETMSGAPFQECHKITEINMPMLTDMGYGFSYCTGLIKAILPKITNVPSLGFRDCTSLKMLDFSNLTSIGGDYNDKAFVGCTALDTIILRGNTICEIGDTTFDGYSEDENTPFAVGGTGGTVYVPEALIESYKTAENWSTLYNAGTCNFVAIEGSEYE